MRLLALLLLILLPLPCLAQQFSLGDLRLTFRDAVVTSLTGPAGAVYARSDDTRGLGALRTLTGDLPAAPALRTTVVPDPASSELIIQQSGTADAGLHGVQWGIAGIPLDCEIIIPGHSGLKFDRRSPVNRFDFNYPMGWECQFVIVQGKTGGFCVWADDPDCRYKTLRLWKRADGWDLAFVSQNLAPFADKTTIQSVKWRLGLTGPNWQDAALRYRKWADANYQLTSISAQQPAWVKDIRAMVLCGLELDRLPALAAAMDPRQTILYVAGWRRDGYDRNYPDYTAVPELAPFVKAARALGFRVMLHVNYFGCDPKNAEYERFKQYHVRDPFTHEPLWWVWPYKGEPDIKFAYINPASRAWRDLFVSRMKELCATYPVDALHLDQTLCIWNDDAGLVDGLTMAQGNLEEHRQLREALPNVALSGEGLNELTCRYEAFAQRHAFGLNHSVGTWDRAQLQMAHPVSSTILRPYTIINGYLGMTNPGNSQLYAAWQQAYINWGVIPTLAWPNLEQLKNPTGFVRQLLDEITFYQRERLDPDLGAVDGGANDGGAELQPAPGAAFSYRTSSNKPVHYLRDNGWRLTTATGQTISRTITGASEVPGPGTIPGWLGYNADRLFGLNPDAWYPWLSGSRDLNAFHVADLPPGLQLARVTCSDDLATVATRDPQSTLEVSDLLATARCGYTVFDGVGEEFDGPLTESKVGASFVSHGHDLNVHPPWKGTRKNPQTGVNEAAGTGTVYCLLNLKLPPDSHARFESEVYMDEAAIGEGKTDGVTFTAEVVGHPNARASLHTAAAAPQPLNLDLSAFAGQDIVLKLTADPGPARTATFDWARWRYPRVTLARRFDGQATVVSPRPWSSVLTPAGLGTLTASAPNTYRLTATFPGAIFLLNRPLQPVTLPCDLTQLPFLHSFISPAGELLQSPQYANASVAEMTVGGETKHSFSTHPPSQGQTRMDFPLQLPAEAKRFTAQVGLRDGSKSTGCLFILEVTGQEIARKLMLPGKWEELSADLTPYAGQPLLLSVVTDADTDYGYDWAAWGTPRLE